MMQIGVTFPQTEIGADPWAIRDYVQAAEDAGYTHLVVFDHVLRRRWMCSRVGDCAWASEWAGTRSNMRRWGWTSIREDAPLRNR